MTDTPNLHELHERCSTQARLARILTKETGYDFNSSNVSRLLRGEAKPMALAFAEYAAANVLKKLRS